MLWMTTDRCDRGSLGERRIPDADPTRPCRARIPPRAPNVSVAANREQIEMIACPTHDGHGCVVRERAGTDRKPIRPSRVRVPPRAPHSAVGAYRKEVEVITSAGHCRDHRSAPEGSPSDPEPTSPTPPPLPPPPPHPP